MARLATVGFESQIFSGTPAIHGEGGSLAVQTSGTVSVETTTVRSGAGAMAVDQGAANYTQLNNAISVLDRAYFVRGYFRFTDATPATLTPLIVANINAVTQATVRVSAFGAVSLRDNSSQIGSASAVLSDNTWYRVELKIIVPT